MTIQNLKLSFRHLGRQKFNTFLHITGLTLGMSVCLLIGLFLQYELSFDTYHQHAKQTYRINSVWTDNGKKEYHFSTPMALANAIRSEVTGLQTVALAHPMWNATVVEINPKNVFKQENILIVEPDFLNIFHIDVIKGNAYEALRKPYQALLTESTAKKFFGNEDPIGKSFKFKNQFNITVAGLIRDLPANTHLPASLLLSYVPDEKYLNNGPDAWSYVSGTSTFVVVPESYDIRNLEAQLKRIADKNINSHPKTPKFVRSDFDIQPLSDIHFSAQYAGGGNSVKAISTSWLWFFTIIGASVLMLACINFINLSTAQALNRAREVGVRKSVGAGRLQLITQFLSEAWILAAISGVLAVAVVQSFLPFMNALLEKGIRFDLLESPAIAVSLIAGIFLIGLLAGLYPAFVIARFNPALALKSGLAGGGGYSSSWLRRALVVTQFTISAGLLIAVILIAQQVNFLRSRNLGFDKDNVINVGLDGARKAPLFAGELERVPQVKDVSFATATPSNEGHWGTLMSLTNREDPNRQPVTLILADDHFCKLYGLKLLSGRFPQASDTTYSSSRLPESEQVCKAVVNEKLVSAMGFASNEAALEKRFWFGMNGGHVEIIGVVANFNTTSLHDAIKPVIITPEPGVYEQASIKIEAGSDVPQAIAGIEAAWKKTYPDGVFEFKFLDAQIDAFYKAESKLYTLFKVFAGLAMLISCLGLWGLSTFAAQQRTKEIGIRKVLGASVNAVVVLLSKDFLIMVTIALVVSTPLAYYLIHNWLQNFAFHIDITWEVFVLAGMASMGIALLTVSVQALKAALANPVNSLRNE